MKTLQLDETRSLEYEMNTGTSATKVVAFGGGACNMANFMHENKTDIDYYIVNDFEQPAPSYASGYVNYPNKVSPALMASHISENWNEVMSPILEGAKRIVVVACLGASGGKVMADLMERLCQECTRKVVRVSVFVTLPFSFEGRSKIKCAQDCLDKMNPYLSDFKMVKNDDMRNHVKSPVLAESFNWVSGQLLEYIR